jgi:hypothetical protein
METKRVAIQQLSPRALDWVCGEILESGKPLGVPISLIHSSHAIVAAHNPSGYVEVPAELVETE